MLVNINTNAVSISGFDAISQLISEINQRPVGPTKLKPGMYEIGHFNFEHILDDNGYTYEEYPKFEEANNEDYYYNCYGVCDTPEQLVEKYPFLLSSTKKYVVSLTRITKANEDPCGGWRWHKWGPYIGSLNPEYEYIYDEGDHIQEVFCFHIYEIFNYEEMEQYRYDACACCDLP